LLRASAQAPEEASAFAACALLRACVGLATCTESAASTAANDPPLASTRVMPKRAGVQTGCSSAAVTCPVAGALRKDPPDSSVGVFDVPGPAGSRGHGRGRSFGRLVWRSPAEFKDQACPIPTGDPGQKWFTRFGGPSNRGVWNGRIGSLGWRWNVTQPKPSARELVFVESVMPNGPADVKFESWFGLSSELSDAIRRHG
jgi:hypothetical protein